MGNQQFELIVEYAEDMKASEINVLSLEDLVNYFPWGKVIFEAESFDGMEWTVDLKHFFIKPIY